MAEVLISPHRRRTSQQKNTFVLHTPLLSVFIFPSSSFLFPVSCSPFYMIVTVSQQVSLSLETCTHLYIWMVWSRRSLLGTENILLLIAAQWIVTLMNFWLLIGSFLAETFNAIDLSGSNGVQVTFRWRAGGGSLGARSTNPDQLWQWTKSWSGSEPSTSGGTFPVHRSTGQCWPWPTESFRKMNVSHTLHSMY